MLDIQDEKLLSSSLVGLPCHKYMFAANSVVAPHQKVEGNFKQKSVCFPLTFWGALEVQPYCITVSWLLAEVPLSCCLAMGMHEEIW